MASPDRITPDAFIFHHSVTPTWEKKSKPELAQWFSDTGFNRGYGGNPSNWSGLINPYNGERSYSMAHLAGQRVDDRTPDATPEERAAGYRLVPLVDDIWNVITWNAGNYPINQRAIGLENLGDYRNMELREGDKIVIADFWRPQDQKLGGATNVYGHREVSTLGTICPANVLAARNDIVNYINNPPQPPAPAPAPAPAPVVEAPKAGTFERLKNDKQEAITLNLQAKLQPTNVYELNRSTWDELSSGIVKKLNQGDPFIAVGKYHHPLGGVYYMTDFSFGKADETGTPDHWYGINTVDLEPQPQAPAPEPVPTPVQEPAPVPETPVADTPAPAEDTAVDIPVKVVPADLNKWQESYSEAGKGTYLSVQQVIIKDLAGKYSDVTLFRGQTVNIAGTFTKADKKYFRTTTSVKNGNWYGIPEQANGMRVIIEDDNVFDDILHEQTGLVLKDIGWFKKMVIKLLAVADSWVHKKK